MLCLAVEAGLSVAAVTVDHGLRPEAAAEAAWVAALCRDLGVPHDIPRWQGWDGAGNLQDQARRARLSLIANWAKGRGIGFVALGHTQDDQAETVLMRLARSAGVDGLSAMAARRAHLGVVWLRPLLGVSRAALRDDLRSRGQGWIDDPSNDALRFDRVKARHVLAALGPLGVDAGVLAGVAARMAEAREALAEETLAAAQALARVQLGDVVIDRAGFLALPAEIRRRLLVGALVWVASAEYGPRAEPVQALLAAIARGRGGTLGGCRVLCGPKTLRITREAKAVAEIIASVGGVWDGRWRITGPQIKFVGNARNIAFWVVLFLLILALFNLFSGGQTTHVVADDVLFRIHHPGRCGEVQSVTLDGERVLVRAKDGNAICHDQARGRDV
jgi:tRNA(Ile)-lysidine synthase